MFIDRTYAALNISASSLKLVSGKGQEVTAFTNMPLSAGLMKDGLVVKPDVVGAIIDGMFKSAGISKERVIVSVTGMPFTYRILTLPRMKLSTQKEAIERAARKEMRLPVEDLYLSWQVISGNGNEQDFFIMGVPRNVLDAAVQTLREARITPSFIEAKPLSLARAANRRDAIIVDLSPDCFDIVLVVNGVVSIMHTFIPKDNGSMIEYGIRKLADELAKTVEFYNSSHPRSPLSPTMPLLFTGELSNDNRISALIHDATGYAVEPLLPVFKYAPDMPVSLFADSIGLAMKRTRTTGNAELYQDISINLLTEIHNRTGRIKPTDILLTVMLLGSISFLPPVQRLNSEATLEITRLQTRRSSIQQELDKRLLANQEATKTQKSIAEIETLVSKITGENQLYSTGSDFAGNLQSVTAPFPAGVYFSSVKMNGGNIVVEGRAANSFTVISYALALEKSGKFSEVRIAWIDEAKSGSAVKVSGNGTREVDSPEVSFNIILSKRQ